MYAGILLVSRVCCEITLMLCTVKKMVAFTSVFSLSQGPAGPEGEPGPKGVRVSTTTFVFLIFSFFLTLHRSKRQKIQKRITIVSGV